MQTAQTICPLAPAARHRLRTPPLCGGRSERIPTDNLTELFFSSCSSCTVGLHSCHTTGGWCVCVCVCGRWVAPGWSVQEADSSWAFKYCWLTCFATWQQGDLRYVAHSSPSERRHTARSAPAASRPHCYSLNTNTGNARRACEPITKYAVLLETSKPNPIHKTNNRHCVLAFHWTATRPPGHKSNCCTR